jgi:putative ABC transport system permease protein
LAAAPMLRARVRLHDAEGTTVTVIGADLIGGIPFAESNPSLANAPGGGDWERMRALLTEPDTAFASVELSPSGASRVGRTLALKTGRGIVTLRVVGEWRTAESESAPFSHAVLVDPATFQERFGRPGYLDAIELIVRVGGESGVAGALPPGLALEPIGARGERVATMARAFQSNLEALGLFTLLVAMFLVFNAASFAVVQRRMLIARLRCIGATRRAVLVALFTEAVAIGLAGSAIGVVAGRALAGIMAEGTSATIFELILLRPREAAPVHAGPEDWVYGLLAGVVAASAAALWPAVEGARVSPLAWLRGEIPARSPAFAARIGVACGLGLWAAGGLLAWPAVGPMWMGLLSATLIALGAALLMPGLLIWSGAALAPLLGRWLGPAARLAARNLTRSPRRTGVAAASLMIALALWLAIAITVQSFRETFELWLAQAVRADIFLAAPEGLEAGVVPGELIAALRERPWLRDLDLLRRRKVVIGEREVLVIGIDIKAFARHAQLPMDAADPAAAYRAVVAGGALVSQTLAYPMGWEAGSILALPTPSGGVNIPISAVVQNYSAPSGVIYLHRDTYTALFGEEPVRSAALFVDPEVPFARIEREIAGLPGGNRVSAIPNRSLRESALRVFDRTFAITETMRAVAGGVAFVAVVSALMALLEERQRILGYLRAIGFSRRRLALAMGLEAVLVASIAAVTSWGTGLAMALVLVFVVNRRAFGWTLQFHAGQGPYLGILAVAVVAALLGAGVPIWKASRLSVVATIREE